MSDNNDSTIVQIRSRLASYFRRISEKGISGTLTLYVRPLEEKGKLRYTIITPKGKGEDTLENILKINPLEVMGLALKGSSKEEAEKTVHDWLLRGLTDRAAEKNLPLTQLGLVITCNTLTNEQAYWIYVNGKPADSIDIAELLNQYQQHHHHGSHNS